ncbi:MAG: electron transfer flavoprotein subunit alpha/FixB family protein [Pirellulales bacterium]|nr:electron transfer flavoprotein subunit alpha/FixB family protein [Pirellulales bacterium]
MSAQDVLVLVETRGGAVADATFELLAAARELAKASGGEVLAVALGAARAEELKAADRIIAVDDPLLADYSPEPFVAAVREVVAAEQPRAVLVGSTSIGWDVGPLLAARLNAPLATGCQSVRLEGNDLLATTSFCGGKMTAECSLKGAPAILMMLPGCCRPSEETGKGAVEQRKPSAPLAAGAVAFQEWIYPEAGDVDITQQNVLVAVGRGIQQQDNVELAEELAQSLGGAVAASRPVIDQGWLPSTRQVGKSGMTVKPKCFLALGISGAPEHVEGMKNSELIVAVNTDPNAPIFDVAHYGAVADIVDLIPALTESLQKR